MKKWLIGAFIAVVILLISFQLFIPRSIVIRKSVTTRANLNGVYRFLGEDSNWTKWWPQSQQNAFDRGAATETEYGYERTKTGFNSFGIRLNDRRGAINSELLLAQVGKDSLKMTWSATSSAESNQVFSKIRHYFGSRYVESRLNELVQALNTHISQVHHIYGLDIRKEKFTTEYLVSKRKVFASSPSTEEIYALIDDIRKEIKLRGATEEDHPMFHIEPSGIDQFELLAAVPVREPFDSKSPFVTLKLLKGGNVLVTEAKGGQATANEAYRKLKQYADDHKDVNVALPFYSLITDRLAVKDTSQWITRVNYPCL
jgi:hypothetical protein